MKQVIISFFTFICGFTIQAQNNVFVLVDVSRSVSQNQLDDAKQALNEVLNGDQLTSAFVAQGSPQDLINFKLAIGDKLALSKFGNISTTLAINPSPTQIQNLNTDINQVLNGMTWRPSDNQTYITLSKAKIAEYAKKNGIRSYKLFIISDEVNDDYGPNGQPNYPNDYTRNLVEGYNTTTNTVIEASSTKIKFLNTSPFTLTFIPNVDVSGYSVPGSSTLPPTTSTNTPSSLKIELTSFKGGTITKPIEVKTDKITISWSCEGAPSGAQYKVRLSPINIPEAKKEVHTTTGPSSNFSNLADGKYQITVSSAQPNLNAASYSTYIEVKTKSLLEENLWLLLLLVAAGGGYWYWNIKRNEKIETTQNANDVFSSDSNDNSSSEYF
jgi:hypothetical protein